MTPTAAHTETVEALLNQIHRKPARYVVESMPMAEYLAAPGLSKHGLDLFAECPEKYWLKREGLVPDESSPAMTFGRCVHAAVFEGRRDYHVKPAVYTDADGNVKKWTGAAKACKEWEAEHNDKPVLSAADDALIDSIRSKIHLDPMAAGLLGAGRAELSLFGKDPATGISLKGRPDWVSADWKTVVDLKTIRSATARSCRNEIHSRRYHVQFAMYRRLLRLCGKEPEKFYFIFVETGSAVPLLRVCKLGAPSLSLADAILDDDLQRFAACQSANHWPGYSGDEIQDIDVPDFAFHAGDENELLEME